MEAFKSNIYKYLSGTCQYIIPVYQRTYSWRKEECHRLWTDILKLHDENREGHFVGSIVRIDEKAAAGSTVAMIIDGQQRLTTLTILLIALRDYARNNIEQDVNPDKIMNRLLVNEYEDHDARYKLLLTQSDREALINKIELNPTDNEIRSKVIDNYDFFYSKIEKEKISLHDLEIAIGKLQIVDIVLDREYDDPQAIFESLNSTGMDLKDSDLIRNHLLMGLDSFTQTTIYNNIWRPTEKLFGYNQQSELLNNFFRDYLTMKLGRIPRKREVYKEFCLYHNTLSMSIEELCSDIYDHASYYTNMFFAKSEDSNLKSLYKDMKLIRMEVAYPFLLRVHHDAANGIISNEELKDIVNLCVSYVLRRAVCDIATNSLNNTFATMKNAINKKDYLNSIKAYFILLDSYKNFPSDERFIRSFKTRDIYNSNKCRFILQKLENWNNKSVVSLDNLTIEHILPQNTNLSDSWKEMLGEKYEDIQKEYLHTIGNLTLTAYNSEMSDSDFTDKLNMTGGFKESALKLNRYVVIQESWGVEQLRERANELSQVANHIWPYPVLTDDEFAPYVKKVEYINEYTLDTYEQWNDINRVLFDLLNTRILNLGSFVKRECKKKYIAYKADTNFVDVVVQKERLRLSINMKFIEVIDPKGICKDISGLGRWGNGEVEVFFNSVDEIENVMDIIKQGLSQQGVEC